MELTIWLGRALATFIRPSGGEGALNLRKQHIIVGGNSENLTELMATYRQSNLIGPISDARRRLKVSQSSKNIFFLKE